MKLEFDDVQVSGSAVFETENFALGDPRVIMDLLSSKIYSRPIHIIVQEVSSNARDANREAGRADTPITIKLPNAVDDNFRIIDNGIGITPDRMKNVFLLYGNSTKREDNMLTGGFGIGAKTPFTYVSSFNIITVTEEDGIKYRRHYLAHKISGGGAQISLVDTKVIEDENELTGTEISFAVAPSDFRAFETATREICNYWEPRPKIIGAQNGWEWEKEQVLHEGKGWKLTQNNPYGYNSKAIVYIDRIPYNLRLNSIFQDTSSEIYRILNTSGPRLFFEVGEITVSATREDLDYSKKTIESVKKRAADLLAEFQKRANDVVANAKTLWEASLEWSKNSASYSNFLVEPTWNGIKLHKGVLEEGRYDISQFPAWEKDFKARGGTPLRSWGNKQECNIDIGSHVSVTQYTIDPNGDIQLVKKYGRIERHIPVRENISIVIDNAGGAKPNKLRLKTFAAQHPNAGLICVVRLLDIEGEQIAKNIWHLSDLPQYKLSNYARMKSVRSKVSKYSINAVKTLVLSPSSTSYNWEPDKTRGPEDKLPGYYTILKHGAPTNKSGGGVTNTKIASVEEKLGIKIHGILFKYRNKIDPSWIHYEDYLSARYILLSKSPDIKRFTELAGIGQETTCNLVTTKFFTNTLIEDKDFEKIVENFKEIDKLMDTWYLYKWLCSSLGHTYPTLLNKASDFEKKTLEKYPLVRFLLGRQLSTKDLDTITEELIFYINGKFAETKKGN